MKTNLSVTKTLLSLAVALAWTLSVPVRADEPAKPMKPMKGGEHQMMLLKPVNTKEEADALKPDDSLAMVCGKCKTVWVSTVKQGTKGAELLMSNGQPKELIGEHACAGCNSTMTVTGHTKGDTTELKHSCKKCGDDSAFCCAMKPGAAATKGMEKEKK